MSDLEQSDQAAAAVSKAPRVTLDDIKGSVGAVFYTDGAKLAQHATHTDIAGKSTPMSTSLKILTLCMVVMKNGYIIIGKSAPASPDNYNDALGRKLALDDCYRQMWPLMGFALKDVLHAMESPAA